MNVYRNSTGPVDKWNVYKKTKILFAVQTVSNIGVLFSGLLCRLMVSVTKNCTALYIINDLNMIDWRDNVFL